VLKKIGDTATFHCNGSNIQWTFNFGPLPPSVYIAYNFRTGLSSLTISILSDSYYGPYRCDGEVFDTTTGIKNEIMGFYDMGYLRKLG